MFIAVSGVLHADAETMEKSSSIATPMPHKMDLRGDYRLEMSPLPEKTGAYDTVTVTYTIAGHGAPPHLETLLPNDGKRHFILRKEHYDRGDFHKRIYRYLIVAEKGLEIPAVKLHAYDPQNKRSYLLHAPAQKIEVLFPPKDIIVDSKNSLPVTALPIAWHRWAGYLAFFAAGFFTVMLLPAFFRKIRQKRSVVKRHGFTEAIAHSNDPAEILKILIAHNSGDFADEIRQLEEILYGSATNSVESIKKEIIRKGEDAA